MSSSGNDSDDPQTDLTVVAPSNVPVYACFRRSPRPCVNQALVDELSVLVQYRYLEFTGTVFQNRKYIQYAKGVSAIVGTPWRITSGEQAQKYIDRVGPKLASKIDEFFKKGFVEEIRHLRDNERFKFMDLVCNETHSIGPSTVRELWDAGFRTPEQVAKAGLLKVNPAYHSDLQIKIPRSEVESLHDFVKIQLAKVEPGAHTMVMGGYRRGKEETNDVDILVTFPHQDGKERRVLAKLLRRLLAKGLIPPDGILTTALTLSEKHTIEDRDKDEKDALDKAHVVMRHPANGTTRTRDYWRRVDFFVCRWQGYGPAVVGLTGSSWFQRDLCILARKRKNIKFAMQGMREDTTNEAVDAPTEKDVFRVIGIPYIEPAMRNA